jgi:hypothetical protein
VIGNTVLASSPNGAWTQFSGVGVCPGGTAYLELILYTGPAMTLGSWYLDAVVMRSRIRAALLFGQAVDNALSNPATLVLGGTPGNGCSGDGNIIVRTSMDALSAWMGRFTVSPGVDYWGIWGKNLWVGGSNPGNAPFYVDANGSVVISGNSTYKTTFSLDLNNLLVKIANELDQGTNKYAGLYVGSKLSQQRVIVGSASVVMVDASGNLRWEHTVDTGETLWWTQSSPYPARVRISSLETSVKVQVNGVNLATVDGLGFTSQGTWDGSHLILGGYHVWVDGSGKLRIKSGAPASATDGTIVGTQS